jgi:hypothetical protein
VIASRHALQQCCSYVPKAIDTLEQRTVALHEPHAFRRPQPATFVTTEEHHPDQQEEFIITTGYKCR